MLDRFKSVAESFFTPADKILLAVSGGVDSMVMLNLFIKSGYDIGVAHCNFSLRGEDSDGDMALVDRVCRESKIPYHPITFNTYSEMASRGESLQITARTLRYEWFSEVAQKEGYTKIAVAHNSGDTIETLFINMLRGTGVRGLAGIPTVRGDIVRPLMAFSREEIESYAISNGVEWREDITNSGTKYLRNKLRHIVLPELRNIEPNFDSVMLANISRIESANSFINSMITILKAKAISKYRGRITLSLNLLSEYQPFDFILYEILSPMGFNATAIGDMERCFRAGVSGEFAGRQYKASLSRGLVILTPLESSEDRQRDRVIDSFEPKYGLSFDIVERGSIEHFEQDSSIAYFDYDKISLPLSLRGWREGDSFVPFGMRGRKKLSDFFIDNKVNQYDKDSVPLLADGSGDILWVVGMRSDNRYRVSRETKKVLIIRYTDNE